MGIILFLLIAGGIAASAIFLLRIYKREKTIWNRGRCIRCDNRWSFVDASYGMRIYKCPTCYEHIAITTEVDTERGE